MKKNLYIIISLLFLSIFILVEANAVDYQYDNLNRLVEIDYGDGIVIQYTYDVVGNRMSNVITAAVNGYTDIESVNSVCRQNQVDF